MKRIALSLSLFLFSALPAHAVEDYSALAMQMAACQTSEDCVVVESACDDWTAINKRSVDGYNELLAATRAKIECDGKKQPKPEVAECDNNFCAVK